jgi:transketolase
MIYSQIRKNLVHRLIDISYKNKEGHIGSSLSILDLLYGIYHSYNLFDQFVLSKGHASLGLYVILEHFDLLHDSLDNFCKFDSRLGGHPYCYSDSSIQCATGSLGHGFPFALGLSMAKKIQKDIGRVYCIIGDGEANEGTIWETALLASHMKINNLYCIMDYNHSGDRALGLGNIIEKFEAFGWDSTEIDGHNMSEILNALKYRSSKPFFILAHTIKGYGIPSIHNNPEWHHKSPNESEYQFLVSQLQ